MLDYCISKLLEHLWETVNEIKRIKEKILQVINTYQKSNIANHLPKSTEEIISILENSRITAEQTITRADNNSRSIDEMIVATVHSCLSKVYTKYHLVESIFCLSITVTIQDNNVISSNNYSSSNLKL